MNYFKVVVVISALILSTGIPKNLQKKVNKEIKQTFNIEGYDMVDVKLDPSILPNLPSNFETSHFFRVVHNEALMGYVYVSKAPSKTDEFDYLIILNKELTIVKSKVLIYREDYGGEIGSKRWLKQFNGKTKSDALRYGDNIVAISGATISVRSMTNAVNDFLRSLKIISEKGQL